MRKSALILAVACGLLGESVEVALLVTGGMAAPEPRILVSLFLAYGVAALLFYALATLVLRRHDRAVTATIAAFAVLLVLPWLNFEYLPKWNSLRTALWSVAVVAVLSAMAPLIARFQRAVLVGVLVAALTINGALLAADRTSDAGAAVGAPRPATNVVVVLIDTLRADHLGAYGYQRRTSPSFDRMAADSVVFDRAVSQAAWTKPAVASLMTGSYVHKHGVMSNRDALGPELPTLAEQMRSHGYRTAAFSSNPWITPEFHFDRGFEHFESGRAMGVQLTNMYRLLMRVQRAMRRFGLRADVTDLVFWTPAGEKSPSNSRRDELMTDAVVGWLGRHAADPFFLYVHLIGPHDPYDPPPAYAEMFRDPKWGDVPRRTVPPPRVQSIFDTAEPLDEVGLASLVAQYDGAIAYSDMLLGRILEALDSLQLRDRTLLVVTADHGEEFYEHRNWRHGNQLYDEVVHVPLAFRLPGNLAPGRRGDAAMIVDIFPSVFGALDLPLELRKLSGQNLFSADRGVGRPVFSEHWRFEGGRYVSRMVFQDGLKMTDTEDAGRGQRLVELYEIPKDPREKDNLLAGSTPIRGRRGEEMKTLLTGFAQNAPAMAAPVVDVDRSTEERLRALGY